MIPMSIVLLLLFVVKVCIGVNTFPYILTTSGAVRGSRTTVLQKEVHAYLGIPYAIPPVGNRRFKPPEPISQWFGIYEASTKPKSCYQSNPIELPWTVPNYQASEDCLYLNVWSPQSTKQKEALKPIMVWIYGGGFYSGSSSLDLYDGSVLAAYGDVIVASMNYRLGIFGFFSANVKDAPGNMGMMDQVLALQWIKNNAEAFGGDPSRITIFGESAGSTSVALHLISPMSSGLFSRAILQSGSSYVSLLGRASVQLESFKAESFSKDVGCATEEINLSSQPDQVISCLKDKDPIELAEKESLLVAKYIVGFIPRIGNDFLPFNLLEKYNSGNINSSHLLLGSTSNEGSVFSYLSLSQEMSLKEEPKWSVEEGKAFIRKIFKDSFSPTPDVVVERYLGDMQEGDYEGVRQAVFNSLGDFLITCPTMLLAQAYASKPDSDVYYYYFDHHPSISQWPKWMGMAHFEDIQFAFGVPLRNNSYTEEERELSRYVMDIWTSFARIGKPELPNNEVWPKYDSSNHRYVELNPREFKLGKGPRVEFCDFWKKYFV